MLLKKMEHVNMEVIADLNIVDIEEVGVGIANTDVMTIVVVVVATLPAMPSRMATAIVVIPAVLSI